MHGSSKFWASGKRTPTTTISHKYGVAPEGPIWTCCYGSQGRVPQVRTKVAYALYAFEGTCKPRTMIVELRGVGHFGN